MRTIHQEAYTRGRPALGTIVLKLCAHEDVMLRRATACPAHYFHYFPGWITGLVGKRKRGGGSPGRICFNKLKGEKRRKRTRDREPPPTARYYVIGFAADCAGQLSCRYANCELPPTQIARSSFDSRSLRSAFLGIYKKRNLLGNLHTSARGDYERE